jgi:hypothetical protein
LTYCHFDSYPSGLGVDVVNFIKNTSVEEMKQIFDKIIMVEENSLLTEAQFVEIKLLSNYLSNGNFSQKNYSTDWYSALRKYQGVLDVYKENLRYMINNNEFIKDSLSCEWAYIINLDENTLEIYKGFQTSPHENRYTNNSTENSKYYPCKLIEKYPLSNIEVDEMLNIS